MRWALAAILVAVGVSFTDREAAAARWCAWYDWSTYNCGFDTFQQCLATIQGIGGECRPDVRGDERPPRSRERRDRRWDRR